MAAKTSDKERYVAYVGTYTHTKSVGIYVYDVNPETGVLTEKSIAPVNNPSNLTISHSGKFLYSIADEGVTSFKILEDGNLEKINTVWNGGMRSCYVRCDDEDRYLFTAGYHDGRVTMMKINEDGSVGDVTDGIFHQGIGRSVAEKKLDPHVTCVEMTPDNKFLCAVDSGLHQMKIYDIDYQRGKLKIIDIVRTEMDAGPRNVRFSADGKFAYLLTEHSNEIYVYEYSCKNGNPEFEKIQVIPILHKADDEISSGTNIKISKDGEFVFTSVDGLNAVVMFRRDQQTGMLSHLKATAISGDYPKSFAIIPGGKYYVSLNHDSNEIRCFTIDYEKGHNLMINPPIKINQPNCIQIHQLVD